MAESKEGKSSFFKKDLETNADTSDKEQNVDAGDKEETKRVGIFQLFRYSTPFDRFLVFIAFVCSMATGAILPVMTVVFSNMIGGLVSYSGDVQTMGEQAARRKLDDFVTEYAIYFIILGVVTFILSYGQTSLWIITGERQCLRIRQLYYAAILRQEISWFDFISSGDLTSRISGDVTVIQEGISQKVGLFVQNLVTFIGGFVLAFVKGWKMALVLLAALPLLAAVGALMTRFVTTNTSDGQGAYASAGGVAEEVLSSIKTVSAFGGQKREILRYNSKLDIATRAGVKKGIFEGIGVGLMILVIFLTYALGFWYGSRLILDRTMQPDQVLNVFFSLVLGAMSLGTASPYVSSISSAQGAAAKVYEIIERQSKIDPSSSEGKRFNNSNSEKDGESSPQGFIEFRNVSFSYPSRPDVPILKGFNLKVKPGQTVALVGSSGSGKSTCIQLLERFYDPIEGSVLIDGIDIKEINVKDLRRNIGLVGQEPVLFGASICQNILWGSKNDEIIPTKDEVEQAGKQANAHEFVSALPEKYDTLVGEKGALLSGGQKQRIAIARALIKNPKILLLDEATSALDTESEGIVQDALDKAAQNRTTIVIAHRLSTIKNADLIVVMQHGVMVESGTHTDLIAQNGVYAGLVKAQELKILEEQMNKKNEENIEFVEDNAGGDGAAMGDTQVDPISKLASRVSQLSHNSNTSKIVNAQEDKNESYSFWSVMKLNGPELHLLLIGTLGSAIDGVIMPIFSIIFTKILVTFELINDNPEKFKKDSNFWSLMFVVLGIVSFASSFAKIAVFSIAGERLTRRLRNLSFTAYLRQEVAFFDDEKNGTGILTSKLSTEAQMVQELTGKLAGTILQAFFGLAAGMIIAFTSGWKLAFVVLACVPVIVIASVLQMKSLTGFSGKTKIAYEKAAQIASESVENMRTVASLAREDTFKTMFEERNLPAHQTAVRGAALSSVGTGFSNGVVYLVYALAFWYGSRLIISGEYDFSQMSQVLFSIMFAAVSVGQASSFTGNISKAKVAANDILELLARKPNIDSSLDTGASSPSDFSGKVDINHAYFSYPSRSKIPILQGFDLSVVAGKSVALVGSSGSGKSTIVALIQRFYDVTQVRRQRDMSNGVYKANSVNVEDIDVRDWNIGELRSHMATVGQEPVLFGCSIGENIAYGIINNLQTREDGSLEISKELQTRIEAAAKSANIHDFIVSLPDGYNTSVGQKGTQLSGGQKQRVAIARAIIRNPKLLLLDEATSALDSESEQVVQAALDTAAEGRTTITIAHRLSTIQNADLIAVVKKGAVIELGTHNELVAKRGFYHMLVSKQNLEDVN